MAETTRFRNYLPTQKHGWKIQKSIGTKQIEKKKKISFINFFIAGKILMRQHETAILIPGLKLHQLKDNGNKNSFSIPNCKIYIKIYPKAKRTYQQGWPWLCPQNRETIYKKKKHTVRAIL